MFYFPTEHSTNENFSFELQIEFFRNKDFFTKFFKYASFKYKLLLLLGIFQHPNIC